MPPISIFDNYVEQLKREFPKFKIVPKSQSRLMAFINFFSRLWNPDFMSVYTTVVGYTVYMPEKIIDTVDGYMVLRHEAVHMRQWKKWWILQSISYNILPIGPSFKAYWEYQGYVESMLVRYERGLQIDDSYIDRLVAHFTGSSYRWMWPFKKSLTAKFKAERAKILNPVP